MQRILVWVGACLLLTGLFWPWLSKLPIGRLPGDIFLEKGNFRLFFPFTTSLLLSLLLTLLLWIFRR